MCVLRLLWYAEEGQKAAGSGPYTASALTRFCHQVPGLRNSLTAGSEGYWRAGLVRELAVCVHMCVSVCVGEVKVGGF